MYKKYIFPLIYIVIIILQRPTVGLLIRIMNSSDLINSLENGMILWVMSFGIYNFIISSIFSIIILLYLRHYKEFKLLAIIIILNGFLQHLVLPIFEPYSGTALMDSLTGYYIVLTLLTLLSFYMVFIFVKLILNPEYHYVIRKIYAPFFIGTIVLFSGPHLVFLFLAISEVFYEQWTIIFYNIFIGTVIHWLSVIMNCLVLYLLLNKNQLKETKHIQPTIEFEY